MDYKIYLCRRYRVFFVFCLWFLSTTYAQGSFFNIKQDTIKIICEEKFHRNVLERFGFKCFFLPTSENFPTVVTATYAQVNIQYNPEDLSLLYCINTAKKAQIILKHDEQEEAFRIQKKLCRIWVIEPLHIEAQPSRFAIFPHTYKKFSGIDHHITEAALLKNLSETKTSPEKTFQSLRKIPTELEFEAFDIP